MPHAQTHVHTREHAHELLDRMAPGQLSALVGLMEAMLDPVARVLANAPLDDEPVTEEEAREVAASRAALARGNTIPHEEILAEFGLTAEDFERMAQTPLGPHQAGR